MCVRLWVSQTNLEKKSNREINRDDVWGEEGGKRRMNYIKAPIPYQNDFNGTVCKY